jgi:hypothetical protein
VCVCPGFVCDGGFVCVCVCVQNREPFQSWGQIVTLILCLSLYLQELVQELSSGEWLVTQRSRQNPSDTAECSKRMIISEAKSTWVILMNMSCLLTIDQVSLKISGLTCTLIVL